MSGLFQRLARQAAGSESARVHTMARLSFVPSADVQTPMEGIAAYANPWPAAASSLQPRQAADRSDVTGDALPPPQSRGVGRAGMSGAASSVSDARPAGLSPAGRGSNRQTAPDSGSGELVRHVPPAIAGEDSFLSAPISRAQATTRSDGDDITFAAAKARIAHIPEPIVESPMAATGNASFHPASGTTMHADSLGDRLRMVSPDTAGGNQPAEVHVHIGRIEVTATQEAPPPRRRASAAPKPMTLDEYLARRKRGA